MSATATVSATLAPAGSGAALDEIVNESLPGVKFLATRLAHRLPAHVDLEDLMQVGIIGLLQSVGRYDPERGVKFQTYANRRIEGAMLDYLRSLDWRPRSVRKQNRRLEEAVATIEQRGENADEEALAVEIGLTASELQRWIQDSPFNGDSLGGGVGNEQAGDNDVFATLPDPSESPEETVEKGQLRKVLAEAIDRLPEKERNVLSLYYYEQLSMKEIGGLLGVKQARVSQLHSQALQRLRRRMRTERRPRRQPRSVPSSGRRAIPVAC